MAAPVNNPLVSQPVITFDGAAPHRLNAAVRIDWGPWQSFGTGTSLGSTVTIQLSNLGTIGARLNSIRGCILDNTQSRSPVALSNNRDWNINVNPGSTSYFPVPINTSNVTVTAVLGNCPTDITRIVFTNYDIDPQSFEAARYYAYGLPTGLTSETGLPIGGAFDFAVDMSLGTVFPVMLPSSAVITRLDIDLLGVLVGASATSFSLAFNDGTNGSGTQWSYNTAGTPIKLAAGTSIPFAKLFQLRYPDFILAPDGIILVFTPLGGTFTHGMVSITGIAQ